MENNLIKGELRQLFNILKREDYYLYKLKEMNEDYDAFFIREGIWKGVAITIDNEEVINKDFMAKFENIKVCVLRRKKVNNEQVNLLCLLTKKKISEEQFIWLCLDFIEPGNDGINRQELINNPQIWVNKWKDLLGNKIENDMDYSFLGELIVLKYLLKNDQSVQLTEQGSHDIESKDKNFEVKTTIMRYISTIEIHSQYQLKSLNGNPLELYFVRLEPSKNGISINNVLEDLRNNYKIEKIEHKIKEMSTESREKTYKVLEIRKYNIDDRFPKIVSNNFKDNKIPENIINIKYVIDLDGIEYENIGI